MRIIVTSGGTAGHINPALAVTQQLIVLGHEVFFAGTPQGLEARLIAAEGIPYQAFDVKGFSRSKPMSIPHFIRQTSKATRLAKAWLEELRPTVVAGFGGYASVPVARAATQMHIPVLVHEQNSTAGWANRMLSQKAAAVALTYEQARSQLSKSKHALIELTGNPVRRSLLELVEPTRRHAARAKMREAQGIPADALVLMVFGGSQGARSINEAVIAASQTILSQDFVHVLHLTGPKQLETVEAQLTELLTEKQLRRWHTIGYCNEMGEAYAASDLIVSRAGASTLAEIAVLGLPALLVPFPHATDDHQTTNARSLVESGAACCIADADLAQPLFIEALLDLMSNEGKRTSMAAAAQASDALEATDKVVNLLLRIAKQ